MSPGQIIQEALRKKLDLIAITDHNSTRQCRLVAEMAREQDLFVLCGCEAATMEEVHCLCYFETPELLDEFQQYLDLHLMVIPNKPGLFGYQVVVDQNDNILYHEDRFLGSSLRVSIDELEKEVHRLGGLFIPAHVDRPRNSLFSQLGFIPQDLQVDALQISRFAGEETIRRKYSIDPAISLVCFSDAHFPEDIGTAVTLFEMEELSFQEIRKALLRQENRNTRIV